MRDKQTTFRSLPIVGVFYANFGKVLLYSRSFSSFFVRMDKILLFEYQQVTRIMKNNC